VAIIVSDLRKSFHGIPALDSTSFMVRDSEFFCLLGQQNSGKSTVISCLSGLTVPDSGLAQIDGRTVGAVDESIAADLGVIFESIFLDLKLTVRGNISFHAALHGISDDVIPDLAARLDITGILNRRLDTLSLGEQRRVDFARALVHTPKVLLLDEPVKGLDPRSAAVIWDVIWEELEYGTTILMATEDAETAAQADRVGVLISGKVAAAGTPDSLVDQYCPSVLALKLAAPRISQHELASVGIDMPDPDENGVVDLRLDSASARDVITLLGDQVLHFEFRNGTLEEVVRVLSRHDVHASTDDVRMVRPVHEETAKPASAHTARAADNAETVRSAEKAHTSRTAKTKDVEDEDPEEDEDAYGNDWVIAPVWAPEDRLPSEPNEEPWDDDIYIRSDLHDQDNLRGQGSLSDRDSFSDRDSTPNRGSTQVLSSLTSDDPDPDPPFAEEDPAWEPWDDDAIEPQGNWRKARGFADTGRRGDYRLSDDSVQRTDDLYDQDPVYADPDEVFDEDDRLYAAGDQPDGTQYDDGRYVEDDAQYADDDRYADDGLDEGDNGFDAASQPSFDQPSAERRDPLSDLHDVIWKEQRRASQADQLDRLAIVTRLLEDAVLTDPLPPFDEKFPIDRLPFVARDYSAPKPHTTWYEEMRKPINEEMAKQARVKLAVEKRIEEARRRREEQGGLA